MEAFRTGKVRKGGVADDSNRYEGAVLTSAAVWGDRGGGGRERDGSQGEEEEKEEG